MSAALRDRLKRCGRYHTSTPSPKRPCISNVTPTISNHPGENTLPETNDESSKDIVKNKPIRNKQKPFTSPLLCNSNRTVSIIPSNKSSAPAHNACDTKDELIIEKDELIIEKGETPVKFQKMHRKIPFTSPLVTNRAPVTGILTPAVQSCPPANENNENDSNTPISRKYRRPALKCRRLDLKHENLTTNGSPETSTPLKYQKFNSNNNLSPVEVELKSLKKGLLDKEEELRKLKMVKMYRTKNNLIQLGKLIAKWRNVSQTALIDFRSMLPQPRPLLSHIIQHLQIDTELIRFNAQEQTFK